MFLEQKISILDWFLMRHWNFSWNHNRFINVSNNECCVPKCKLKDLTLTQNQVNRKKKQYCNSRHVASDYSLLYNYITPAGSVITAIHKKPPGWVTRFNTECFRQDALENLLAVYLGNSSRPFAFFQTSCRSNLIMASYPTSSWV